MFEFIRTHQRLMQFVLLVLILPSFALIGVSGYSTYVSGDKNLVEVGSSAVTLEEFDQARRRQLENLQTQLGGAAFDPAVLDTPDTRAELLESLIDRRVIINQAQSNRLSISDAILRQQIAAIPDFQEDGRFSPERYKQILAAMGISSRDFEQGQRGEVALQRVLGPVVQTARVPDSVSAAIKNALTAERTVRLRPFSASDFTDDITISEDDIQQWYDNNQDRLQVPESVSAQFLILDEAAAMKALPQVTDDQLRAYYQQNKARYVRPGRHQISHIYIEADHTDTEAAQKAREKAEDVARQLASQPDRFADIAIEQSDDAGTAADGGKLGWITPGSWPASLEQPAFALKAGEISDVVEGPDGFHIFKALEVEPEQGESFEQAKAKVEAEVRRQLGAERYAEMATELTDLVYDNPDSLDAAAQTLGLDLKTAAGIAADRLLPASMVAGNAATDSTEAEVLADPRVRRALFSSKAYTDRHNTGVIEISPDTIIVLRVEAITPAHVQALDQAQDGIRTLLENEQALAQARKAGEAVVARLLQSEATDNKIPEQFSEARTISRISAADFNKSLLDAVFAVDVTQLPAYKGVATPEGYVIVRIEGAAPGTADEALFAGFDQELRLAQAQAEENAVLKAMRTQAGVKILPQAQEVLQGEEVDS